MLTKYFYVEIVNFNAKEKNTYYVYFHGNNETEIFNGLEDFIRDHSEDEDYVEWEEINEGTYRINMNEYGELL